MVVLGGRAFSYGRGTPVDTKHWTACRETSPVQGEITACREAFRVGCGMWGLSVEWCGVQRDILCLVWGVGAEC